MSHEAGTIIDTESIRRVGGDAVFAAFDKKLRDDWAAKCFYRQQRAERIKAISDRMEHVANDRLGGMRMEVRLDPWANAWLNKYLPGCWEDPTFTKDLLRHHPEVGVKLNRKMNRVGWTPSLNRGTEGQRDGGTEGRKDIPVNKVKLVLTDKRGQAA